MIKHAYILPSCDKLIYYIEIEVSGKCKTLKTLAILKMLCYEHLVNAQIKSVHATWIQSYSVCSQARRIPRKL